MGTVSDRGAARDSQLPFLPSPPIAPESALGGTALTAAMAQRLVSLHPSSGAETLQALRRAFGSAQGVSASIPDDIQAAIWRKFLLIVSWSGVGAITRVPLPTLTCPSMTT